MPTEIRIPKIGATMTEATLSEWLAEDGATIEAGAPLYAIEMDKSTNEIESPAAGVLKHLAVVGETYEVGTMIAIIE
jgi:pyruvate/2-oxoglutarate dehydrogenase complex dihydrolipoamide acyltransferase (E2) component